MCRHRRHHGHWWSIGVVNFLTLLAVTIVTEFSDAQGKRQDKEVILDINDPQKSQYLNQEFDTNVFSYGYDINSGGPFHHEIHGPDEVTYGCYGHTNRDGQLSITYYVSDDRGYRVVQPQSDVELFIYQHEHNNKENKQDGKEDHHDHQGIVTAWKHLHFPPLCKQLAGYPNGPGGPVGGVDGKGDVGGIGGVGPDGSNGPWPTGSPGPNGPWPGDPDYMGKKDSILNKKL